MIVGVPGIETVNHFVLITVQVKVLGEIIIRLDGGSLIEEGEVIVFNRFIRDIPPQVQACVSLVRFTLVVMFVLKDVFVSADGRFISMWRSRDISLHTNFLLRTVNLMDKYCEFITLDLIFHKSFTSL